MDAYLNSLYAKSQSMITVTSYAHQLALFFACHGSRVKYPEQYTRQDVEAFLARPGLHGETAKPATRSTRLAILGSFYAFVAAYTVPGKDGKPQPLFSQASPTAGLHHGKQVHAYRQFSDDELRSFFTALPDRSQPLGALYFSLFQLYFYSCRRREELLRLQWQDITAVVFGDGRTGFTYEWTGKGDAGQRHVSELPTHIFEAIAAYLHITGRWEDMRPESYVFVGTSGRLAPGQRLLRTHQLTGNSVYRMLKLTCKRAGLDPKRFCIHSFRHTGARVRYSLNHDPIQIMQHLGHKSLQTSYVYLQALSTPEDKAAADVYAKFRDL